MRNYYAILPIVGVFLFLSCAEKKTEENKENSITEKTLACQDSVKILDEQLGFYQDSLYSMFKAIPAKTYEYKFKEGKTYTICFKTNQPDEQTRYTFEITKLNGRRLYRIIDILGGSTSSLRFVAPKDFVGYLSIYSGSTQQDLKEVTTEVDDCFCNEEESKTKKKALKKSVGSSGDGGGSTATIDER